MVTNGMICSTKDPILDPAFLAMQHTHSTWVECKLLLCWILLLSSDTMYVISSSNMTWWQLVACCDVIEVVGIWF